VGLQVAWEKVKANKGAPGVDGVSVEGFEKDLQGNLYMVWNRLSSGTYFPPPVRAVQIPKPVPPGPVTTPPDHACDRGQRVMPDPEAGNPIARPPNAA